MRLGELSLGSAAQKFNLQNRSPTKVCLPLGTIHNEPPFSKISAGSLFAKTLPNAFRVIAQGMDSLHYPVFPDASSAGNI